MGYGVVALGGFTSKWAKKMSSATEAKKLKALSSSPGGPVVGQMLAYLRNLLAVVSIQMFPNPPPL